MPDRGVSGCLQAGTFRLRARWCGWSLTPGPHGWLLCLVAAAAGVDAQTVRGTVTDGLTGLPAAGAVVILERLASDSVVTDSRSVLAGRDGAFSVRAAGTGPARLHVRRIGALPFRVAFSLDGGEVRVVDVQMQRVPPAGSGSGYTLGRIHVRRGTPCQATDDGEYIATLWDDARTALMATEIAGRDSMSNRRLIRYVREMDLPSLKVFAESLVAFDRNDANGIAMFGSRTGDELSRDGYMHSDRYGAILFFGPDANALLSEAFVRDHCFRLAAAPRRADADRLLLNFEPVPARTRPYTPAEIAGSISFDPTTSELRQIDFDWVSLRADTSIMGGEVRFTSDSSGAWYVSSWRLRMPREVLLVSGRGTVGRRQTLLEEGGLVLDDLPTSGFVPGTVTGVVRDSRGRGLAGAVVRVIGTELRTVSDTDGRYTLAGIPPGLQFVVADHLTFSDLGVRLGQHRALITEGVVRELMFSAPTLESVGSVLCGPARRPPNTAILRVMPGGGAGAVPNIRLAMAETTRAPGYRVTMRVSPDGSAVFCDAPAGVDLVLSDPRSADTPLVTLNLRKGDVVSWTKPGSAPP